MLLIKVGQRSYTHTPYFHRERGASTKAGAAFMILIMTHGLFPAGGARFLLPETQFQINNCVLRQLVQHNIIHLAYLLLPGCIAFGAPH